MRILVTGGAGFIGANFVSHVIKNTTYEVVTLDNLTYAGSREKLDTVFNHDRHEFVEGSICDQSLVDNLCSRVDAVVNFAAETHVDRSIGDASLFVKSNVQGVQTLLDSVTKNDIGRFIQISTDEVYGEIEKNEFVETDSLNPRNPYAATKAAADHLCKSYYTTHGTPVLITRSCNNFGPLQNKEKLIPKFISLAAAGEPLPVYGDGTNVREWIYVEDKCRAVLKLLEAGSVGEIYNIGTGERLSNIEVTKKIIESVGASDEQIQFVEDRKGHDQRYAVNANKIRNLGWEPQLSFDEGLKKTVEYYIDTCE